MAEVRLEDLKTWHRASFILKGNPNIKKYTF